MPHLPKDRKDALRENPKIANCEGDYNFLYTVAYLQHWLKEGNQRYKTIHELRKASIQPLTIDEVGRVETALTEVPMLDRIVARDLAFREFERLVVTHYEDYCTFKNGIVEEYLSAIQIQNKLIDTLTFKEFK